MRAAKVVVVTVSILSLFLVGSPASAETRTKADRTDDAPARIDITRARYSYGNDQVKVVARIPKLGRVGEASLSITRFEIFEAGYVVRIIKRAGKPAKVGLYFFDHFDLNKRNCDQVSGMGGHLDPTGRLDGLLDGARETQGVRPVRHPASTERGPGTGSSPAS